MIDSTTMKGWQMAVNMILLPKFEKYWHEKDGATEGPMYWSRGATENQ